MAKRFVYLPMTSKPYVKAVWGEFHWEAGMAISQRAKSSANLHKAIQDSGIAETLLECSRAGDTELGEKLSAFNLPYYTEDARTVETAYQASKVFEKEGEEYEMGYLAMKDSMTAKKTLN